MTRDEFRNALANAGDVLRHVEFRIANMERALAAFDALTAENERLRRENAKYDAASLDFAAEIKRLRTRLVEG